MPTGQHPDTYTDEASSPGQGIQSIPSAVGAILAPMMQGPTEKAVQTLGQSDFTKKFGGCIPGSYGAYTAKAVFDQNGGGLLYGVRIVHKLSAAAIPAGSAIAPLPNTGTANSATAVNISLPGATQALAPGTLLSIGGQVALVKTATIASPNSATVQLVTLLTPLPLGTPATGTLVSDFHATTFKQSAPSQAYVSDTAFSAQPTRLYQSLYDGLFYNGLSISTKPNPVIVTTLAAAANAGSTQLTLTSTKGLQVGHTLKIPNSNPSSETVLVAGVLGNVATLSAPLQNTYSSGTSIAETSYDLTIFSYGAQKELWKQLSTSPTAPNYDIASVNSTTGGSAYIKIIDLFSSSGIGNFPATVTNVPLSGGLDGLVNPITGSSIMTDQDYIGDPVLKTGLYALDAITSVVLHITIPGVTTAPVQAALTAYSENRKDTFPVLDSALGSSPAQVAALADTAPYLVTNRSCLFYPWIRVYDPIGQGSSNTKLIPPSGFAIGQFGRTDKTRGVFKAPAGQETQLINALDVEYRVTNDDHDILNPVGVNVIRGFAGLGIIIDGARTLSSASGDTQFNVINVRRLFLQAEKECKLGTRFAIFEPVNAQLANKLYLYLYQYFLDKFNRGWFAGTTPGTSFVINIVLVPEQDRVNISVGLAPSRPGEFIYITFSQVQAGATIAQASSLGV